MDQQALPIGPPLLTAYERKQLDNPIIAPTLGQRLDLICKRLGVRTRPTPLSHEEKRQYLRWLAQNDPTADNPYTCGRLAPLVGASEQEVMF